MRWIILTFVCAVGLAQDHGLPKEALLLSRIRRSALENLERMPNYVCLETIARSYQLPKQRRFTPHDRIALEVAHLEGKELFAWPGQDGFQERTPGELVSAGASSTGEFALHVRSMFLNRATTIRYSGEERIGRTRAVRYDFRVPAFADPLVLRTGERIGIASARGSFWADPRSYDLLRLDVQAEDIPPEIDLIAASTRIEHHRVRIGHHQVVLPRESEMRLTNAKGVVLRNVTTFSNCREYTGSSTIRYGDDAPPSAPAPLPVDVVELPAGLSIVAELQTPLDPVRDLIGGPVRARVSEPAGDVPKGAEIAGRIRSIERRPDDEVLVAVEFTDLSYGRKRAVFRAQFEGIESAPRRNYVRFSPAQLEPELRQPGIAAIFISNRGVSRGLVMLWRTQ